MDTQYWQTQPIRSRSDGSYVISHKIPTGAIYDYHVPGDMQEFADLFAAVSAYAEEHPEQVTAETPETTETSEAAQ